MTCERDDKVYIVKNAWLNITRNKGRNILIGLIILVIACVSTITLAIKNTATSLIKAYKDAYPVEATVSFNRGSMRENIDYTNEDGMEDMKNRFSSIESLTEENVKNYADSKYVNSYYYTYSVGLNASNIEKVSSDFSFDKGRGGDKKNDENTPKNMGSSSDFTLMGYSDVEAMNEFITGSYTMKEQEDDAWNLIFDGNYCMINNELAELNEVSVGSELTFTDPDDETKTITLKVVGIFEESSSDENVNEMSMFSNSANTIITNVGVIDSVKQINSELKFELSPKFELTSYEDAEAFEAELYEKGMSEYLEVSTNESEVESATKSIANVSSFVTTFLVLTFIIGVVVLLVINQINVRERRYEIGVLRTIGMKKKLLTMQFVVELLIVSMAFLIIGAGIGSVLAKPIGNQLLQSEIESSQNTMDEVNQNFGNGLESKKGGPNNFDASKINGMVSIQAYDSINAVVDIKVIIELLGIGLLLTLIGSITSVTSIQKFSPLQILKERS